MATSRLALRQSLGDKTGEVMVLTATDGGTVNTFEDVVHLGDRGDNAPSLMGRIGYFSGETSGDDPTTNGGHECRITAFDATTRTLSFTPDADTDVIAGDELELWAISDRVGSIGAIHRFLNDGIRAVADIVGSEVYDTAQTFNAYSPTLTIPSTWGSLGGIEWADRRGLQNDINMSDAVVRRGRGTVEITGYGARLAHNMSVTLWGHERASALDADTDETDVDAEWLVEHTISAMALAQSWRATDRAAEERRANFWKGSAAELRRKVGAVRRGWNIPL